MDALDDLNIEAESLLSGIDMDIDDFEEACDFIENHVDLLCTTEEDKTQFFNVYMSLKIYFFIFSNHLSEQHKWVEAFEGNEFQLQQCIYRLRAMKVEMKGVLEKVIQIKFVVESKLAN
jgi:hypothetical protein